MPNNDPNKATGFETLAMIVILFIMGLIAAAVITGLYLAVHNWG